MLDKQLGLLKASLDAEARGFGEKLMQRLRLNDSNDDFLRWLARYDAFNRGFPGAAAELAGRIAGRIELFGDIEAEMVASRVIAAITDEFMDRKTGALALHSKLRRELVIFCLGNLSGQSRDQALETINTYNPFREEMLVITRKGYGLENQDRLRGIFSGLGFFTASETSGSSEFVILNSYMNDQWPRLKSAMQAQNDDQGRALYSWIVDHEDLEADHVGFALSSIELALQYLKLEGEQETALEAVKQGIFDFFQMASLPLLIR